jgi:hypothetical protein
MEELHFAFCISLLVPKNPLRSFCALISQEAEEIY